MAINIDLSNTCCGDLSDNYCAQLAKEIIEDRIGDCLSSSYGDSIGSKIGGLYVCWFVSKTANAGEITSEKAPNGASTSYDVTMNKEGLQSNEYGRMAYDMDINQCWQGLVAQAYMFDVIGDANPPAGSCY